MAKRKKRKYTASASASFTDKEAQIIGELMEKAGGELSTGELIEFARPKNSPLHQLFEWDDTKAAAGFRDAQAKQHVRCIRITVVKQGKEINTRACHPVVVNDTDDGARRTNMSYDRLHDTPDLAQQVVARASGHLKQWRHRYANLTQVFGDVFDAIDNLED